MKNETCIEQALVWFFNLARQTDLTFYDLVSHASEEMRLSGNTDRERMYETILAVTQRGDE